MFTLKSYISVDNTLQNIFNLIKSHYADPLLKPFDKWSLLKVFNYVSKGLHYIPDPKNVPIYGGDDIELLKSPVQTINTNGGDCDDKSILIGALMQRRGVPYRFAVVVTEKGRDWHHIYPEIFVQNQWKPFDATYSYNMPYTETPFIKKRIFEIRNGRLIAYTTYPKACCNKSVNYNDPQCRKAILNGARASLGLSGTRLALLEGVPLNRMQRKEFLNGCYKTLLGNSLGFDPATITAVGITIFKFLFGGGGAPIPPNINLAFQNLNKAADDVFVQYGNVFGSQEAMQKLAMYRSIKAVMLDKWGLIPPGKAIHDVWPNVPWGDVQGEIESKAGEFFPMLYWIHLEDVKGKWPKGYEADTRLVQLYNDFKNKSGAYNQYAAATQTNKKTKTAGTGTNTLLIFGLVGAGAYMVFSK